MRIKELFKIPSDTPEPTLAAKLQVEMEDIQSHSQPEEQLPLVQVPNRNIFPETSSADAPAKEKQYLLRVIGVQAAVCVLLIGFALLFKVGNGDTFAVFKAEYGNYLEDGYSSEEVAAVWKQFVGYISETGDDTPATTTTTTTTQPSSAPSGEDEDHLGKGGEDLEVEDYQPPESATLAPYLISAPITIPVDGTFSSRYGYRIHPITGKLSFHTGLDIAADEGENIVSAYYGTVEEVGEQEAYGNYILVDHGNGLKTYYAHCSEIVAEEGMIVRAGEVIAKVGSTGWSTGPHLHFEIRIDGIYHDPMFAIEKVLNDN